MKVTVLVDGREAVPVRALPFVTGWRLSPDALIKDLARHRHHSRHKEGLRAFQLDVGNGHPEIMPAEWDQVIVRLNALDKRLDLDFAEGADAISYAKWREDAPAYLPKACFVWRDEFEIAFRGNRTSAALHEVDEELDLNFSPLVPPELELVVMEGFAAASDKLPAATSVREKWPWGSHDTALLQHLAEAAERFWARYDPSDMTTAPKNEDVVAWLEGQGVSNNVAKVIATILRAEGVPTGPRK